MSDFFGWRANRNIAMNYINAIRNILVNDDVFNRFRNGYDGYASILEHLKREEGQIYANYIIKNYWELLQYLQFFKENDTVGSPILFNYEHFGDINPTTLRYIKFAGDIKKHFGDLTGYNLVEIGGGYGGLVKILNCLFKFNSIKMFDLPEALKLQKKYLSRFNNDVDTYTINDDIKINEDTIVISNYAWCECDRPTRDKYMEKIINKSKYVYMVVYDVDVDNELMSMDGIKILEKETLNACEIFTKK